MDKDTERRRRDTVFNPQISLGNILTMISICLVGLFHYFTLSAKVDVLDKVVNMHEAQLTELRITLKEIKDAWERGFTTRREFDSLKEDVHTLKNDQDRGKK